MARNGSLSYLCLTFAGQDSRSVGLAHNYDSHRHLSDTQGALDNNIDRELVAVGRTTMYCCCQKASITPITVLAFHRRTVYRYGFVANFLNKTAENN